VIQAAQAKRDELRDVRLPQVLDEHLPGLPETTRRRLLASLRGLMTEQHRVLLQEVGRRGAPEAAAEAPGAPEAPSRVDAPLAEPAAPPA
jgi:hypothetical protein